MLAASYASGQSPPTLAAQVTFRCLWWSESQMVGLNPNSPPPKGTEVVIRKWEYSDPVGVPHPDTVDVVVELENKGSSPAAGVTVVVTRQWLVGSKKSRASAKWSAPEAALTSQSATIAPGQTLPVRATIDLASRMAELDKKGQWPWGLRALVTVRGGDKVLLTSQAELPISRGD